MHLVIDGYNLIHLSPELEMAEAMGQGVDALATSLNLYRKKKQHKITLVLDGGPDQDTSRHAVQGIPVVMSGAGRTADDVIAEMASRHGPGLTVITNDRELQGRCQSHGAQVVDASDFAQRMMDVVMTQGVAEFADPGLDDGWDFSTRKKGPSKKLKKAKRKKRRALDQL